MNEVRNANQRWLKRVETYINIDSTSGNEAGFLAKLEQDFNSAGYETLRQEVAPNRWNLLCLRPESPNPELLFSTHVDCVPPFIPARFEEDLENGTTIYGRGACDTKGGIVAMIAAAERLLNDGLTSLGFLFVVGEEVDHCGAIKAGGVISTTESTATEDVKRHPFFERLKSVRQVILCEPTENRVTAAQKGMLKMRVATCGKAAHSAYPHRGESAVDKLLDLLQRWRDMSLPEDPILGPTTVNIGLIEGGVAANVLAPSAKAEVLVRAVSSVDELKRAYLETNLEDASIEVPAANDPVFFEPPEGVETATVAFNTDATYLRPIGPIWLVGPGTIEVAHSDHEHIILQDLLDGIDLYERLGRLVLGE